MNAIDQFSKFAYSEPMKDKTAKSINIAMAKILDRTKYKPKAILTDREFLTPEFESLIKKYNIFHHATAAYSPFTNGAVERFNKTEKEMMFEYFNTFDTYQW